MKKINLLNKRFGRLLVIKDLGSLFSGGKFRIHWLCKCDCGKTKTLTTDVLRADRVVSCGCYATEVLRERSIKHGLSIGYKESIEYKAWAHAKSRCYNINDPKYKIYGERGIKMCSRWLNNPELFVMDMGLKPKGTSLDRIDVNGNYDPKNCRWATAKQQSNNTRSNILIKYQDKEYTMKALCEKLNLNYKLFWNYYRKNKYKLETCIERTRYDRE